MHVGRCGKTQRDTGVRGWVGNDTGGLCNVDSTQKQARGRHRGHGYTYLRTCNGVETRKKQMIAEGHRFDMTDILHMYGCLMVAHR